MVKRIEHLSARIESREVSITQNDGKAGVRASGKCDRAETEGLVVPIRNLPCDGISFKRNGQSRMIRGEGILTGWVGAGHCTATSHKGSVPLDCHAANQYQDCIARKTHSFPLLPDHHTPSPNRVKHTASPSNPTMPCIVAAHC